MREGGRRERRRKGRKRKRDYTGGHDGARTWRGRRAQRTRARSASVGTIARMNVCVCVRERERDSRIDLIFKVKYEAEWNPFKIRTMIHA